MEAIRRCPDMPPPGQNLPLVLNPPLPSGRDWDGTLYDTPTPSGAVRAYIIWTMKARTWQNAAASYKIRSSFSCSLPLFTV